MKLMLGTLLPTCAFLLGVGCATPSEKTATITGTVTYRQRIALPPKAVVEVRLMDVSQGEAAAVTIAEKTIPNPGQVPLSYALVYHPAILEPGHRYAVQARILVDDKPWMVTETVNHLMEYGRIAHAEVILRPAK